VTAQQLGLAPPRMSGRIEMGAQQAPEGIQARQAPLARRLSPRYAANADTRFRRFKNCPNTYNATVGTIAIVMN